MIKSNGDFNSQVDLHNGILYGTLKQIRLANDKDPEEPALIPVWTCTIEPQQTKSLITILKDKYDDEQNDTLKHLKRMTKEGSCIRALICPYTGEPQKQEIERSLHSLDVVSIDVADVPARSASTKQTSLKWSQIWPMTWKGNPNHQFLNSSLAAFDMEQERRMIQQLLDSLGSQGSNEGSVTIMAKEIDKRIEIQTIAVNDGDQRPTKHSVMRAIEKIAQNELSQRNENSNSHNPNRERGYLCTKMIVYTTHEPCVMCSMALVHSRIERCTYLKEVPHGGGMESSYYLGDRDGLNWRFPIWKWLGKDEIKRLEESTKDSTRSEY
ncbi:uncharacterized protein LODBEIA_P04140 [Lodderomyces beijingensis]|uniref:CMP/dCMP-type deaminase domain-containing protein n=1 Tax=Lodderomyces beijingensis TaxID=1775926 RepID=A0ABP0ZDD6_9ASCO